MFGLLGHLIEMLEQSGCRAMIAANNVPAYPHAQELARAGLASTLLPENLAGQAPAAAAIGAVIGGAANDGRLVRIVFSGQNYPSNRR